MIHFFFQKDVFMKYLAFTDNIYPISQGYDNCDSAGEE